MNTKKLLIVFGVILAVIIAFVVYKNSKPWMLSVYRGGQTIMRLDYPSNDTCLSAGRSYIADKTAERFDCGYKCYSFDRNNLQGSPICKAICNDAGCR